MHGKRRPKLPSRLCRLAVALAALLLTLPAPPAAARELRRQMPFLRPLLMGDAYTAVGDESSALLYNPAGLARIQDGSVEALSLQFNADRDLTDLLLNPSSVSDKYSGIAIEELEDLIGTSLFYDAQLRVPIIVVPAAGAAYGIGMEQLTSIEFVTVTRDLFGFQFDVPALSLEVFLDQTAFWTTFTKVGPVSLGLTVKGISRAGLDKTIDALTLFASGAGLDLEQDDDYQNLVDRKVKIAIGSDVGMLIDLPFAPDWQPRLGLSILNLGGYETGRGYRGFHGIEFGDKLDEDTPPLYGEFPLNVSLGFAMSPTFDAIRYTFALDVVDLTQTAIEGDSLSNRLRLGFEVGIGPHEDGTALFSVLFGWNATHFSTGILSRVWIFEIGFGSYTVEKGSTPGANPSERRVLLISFRF